MTLYNVQVHAICRLYSNQYIYIYTLPALTRNYMILTLLFFFPARKQSSEHKTESKKSTSIQHPNVYFFIHNLVFFFSRFCFWSVHLSFYCVFHSVRLQPISTRFSFRTLSAAFRTVKYACERKTGCKAFKRRGWCLYRDKDAKYFQNKNAYIFYSSAHRLEQIHQIPMSRSFAT